MIFIASCLWCGSSSPSHDPFRFPTLTVDRRARARKVGLFVEEPSTATCLCGAAVSTATGRKEKNSSLYAVCCHIWVKIRLFFNVESPLFQLLIGHHPQGHWTASSVFEDLHFILCRRESSFVWDKVGKRAVRGVRLTQKYGLGPVSSAVAANVCERACPAVAVRPRWSLVLPIAQTGAWEQWEGLGACEGNRLYCFTFIDFPWPCIDPATGYSTHIHTHTTRTRITKPCINCFVVANELSKCCWKWKQDHCVKHAVNSFLSHCSLWIPIQSNTF